MGKGSDGDIVDFMLGCVVDVFSWIFGILLGLALGAIKFVGKFLVSCGKAIFQSKEENESAE